MKDQAPAEDVDPEQQDGAGQDRSQSRRRGSQAGMIVMELAVILVGALVMATLVRVFVVQLFVIPSGSMQNTLDLGDRVVVSKMTDFKRGDIVVFEDPDNWIVDHPAERSGLGKLGEKVGVLPATSTNHLVKRVIGMPGDRVKCCDAQGRMTVNGTPLEESSYLYLDEAEGQNAPSDTPFEVVVPKDRIFVMGDHRAESGDSRIHLTEGTPKGMRAFVPISDVVGPVVAIAAPVKRWTAFSTPETFAGVPAPASPAPDNPTVIVGSGG